MHFLAALIQSPRNAQLLLKELLLERLVVNFTLGLSNA